VLTCANVEFPLLLGGAPVTNGGRGRSNCCTPSGSLTRRLLPEELSGGQQQRVGIARRGERAGDPVPTSRPATSTAPRRRDLAVLTELAHTHGLTLVMVTHDAERGGAATASRS
jgi:predicted ABC-type transport system involved in lysophospholipase L1 biosynthesis ATPase subunit